MKQNLLLLIVGCLLFTGIQAQQRSPLQAVELVANRIVDRVDFSFILKVNEANNKFNSLKHIDFGKEFGLGKAGVAYALTAISSETDQDMLVDISHNDGLKIWLNDSLIYHSAGQREVYLVRGERSLELDTTLRFPLRKGNNRLLLKSETRGKEWIVYLQPSGTLIEFRDASSIGFGLQGISDVDKSVYELSNWLIAGPFPHTLSGKSSSGLDVAYPPEKKIMFGNLYEYGDVKIAWTIPKTDIFADVKDAHPLWGSYYNYNYHTGGVAWTMMHLSDFSGNTKYDNYAKKYCDFMIQTKPFVNYQVHNLHGSNSVNNLMIETPLLDFTLAPSLPFIYRLTRDKLFASRPEYETWGNGMIRYAIDEQSRSPEGNFNRNTPEKYTTWTDDMFMGLPFLMLASEYTADPSLKQTLLNDAASQVLAFNEKVFNKQDKLYQHAQYSARQVKMPYWTRANGWGIWAVTEVLQGLPENNPYYRKILKHYREHVETLVKYQVAESGFWNNVIDVPASGAETSGTAIITMAIARGINQGWIPREKYEAAVLNGWKALDTVISSEGEVAGICMGTMCSEDINYYLQRPILDNDSHGILGLIMAGIEVEKMLNDTVKGK